MKGGTTHLRPTSGRPAAGRRAWTRSRRGCDGGEAFTRLSELGLVVACDPLGIEGEAWIVCLTSRAGGLLCRVLAATAPEAPERGPHSKTLIRLLHRGQASRS